jgi:hypothetical protein
MTAFMPCSFMHCADLHLDASSRGNPRGRTGIAAVFREATFTDFDRIIELALGDFWKTLQPGGLNFRRTGAPFPPMS